MPRIIKRKVDSSVHLDITTVKTDGTETTRQVVVDQLVEGLRYVEDEEVKTATGNVDAITLQSLRYGSNYKYYSQDNFTSRVLPTNVKIDVSKQYDSSFVDINPFEIVEDEGVTDVEKVTVTPVLDVKFTFDCSDGVTREFSPKPNQYLHSLAFKKGADVTLGTYRLITYITNMKKNISDTIDVKGIVVQDGFNIIRINTGEILWLNAVSDSPDEA